MAAKRNASGLSALPRPSLDNEELVRNDDHLVDSHEVDVNEVDVVDKDQRKPDQICNSLKRLIRDYLGKILGAAILGRGEKNIKEHCPPLLLAGRSIGVENYKFTGMITFALQTPSPQTVFANNQILRTPSIALGIFSTQKREIPLKLSTSI